MEATSTLESTTATSEKRKRSPSIPSSAPPPKAAKTSTQLSINYLARQSQEDLPLITKDDTLPNLVHLLASYNNILDRHESLASNLGARPLGPILIKRFERCFDAPPKVVASHHKNANGNPEDTTHTITWLEVIEFARSHPGQFTLSTFSEGRRVCQFYYPQKQLRVQISEEDFLFINSGRCQELIPPLPIWEDEEKEVGTCDVLEAKLKELTNAADMVAARTRQLSHRLKGRRAAILERRAEGGSGTPAKANALQTTTAPPAPPGSGFVAVNATNGRTVPDVPEPSLGTNAAVRTELLRHFESLPHNQAQGKTQARHQPTSGAADTFQQVPKNLESQQDGVTSNTSSLSPVPPSAFPHETLPYSAPEPLRSNIVHRPSSSTGNPYTATHAPLKHNFSRPLPPALESSQPFRPLCQAHMDGLPRGHRVLPPCDRCRRLRMDCVKNLTSCAGCTRKHARCHWREVSRDELGALDHLMDSNYVPSTTSYSPTHTDSLMANGYTNGGSDNGDPDESDDDDSNPLEDLEALGEKEEQENQIREDEEGLRNAKELARQGWEDSLRSAQQLPEEGPDVNQQLPEECSDANGDPLKTNGSVEQNHNVSKDEVEEFTAADKSGEVEAKQQDGDEIQVQPRNLFFEQASKLESADERPVSHGGFRAVNETMNGATSITPNTTGWRAM